MPEEVIETSNTKEVIDNKAIVDSPEESKNNADSHNEESAPSAENSTR